MKKIGSTWMRGAECIFAVILLLVLYHPAVAQNDLIERAEPAMGTVASIVVDSGDERAATAALNAAFARIREIEQRLSDYIGTSEARQLERAPVHTAVPVSPDLYRVLEHGLALARATGGAFDPTLGRATRAWREGKTPAKGRYRDVRLVDGAVVLLAAGVAFDFGGIAKGYAADEALNVLRTRGFPRAMVALSGDIALGDAPAGRKGWRVGLGSKDHVEELANCGVSTSGDAHQARRGESHILDGRAGVARRARPGSVTVIAPTAMGADALATAIHAMGKEEAEKGLLPKADFRVFFGPE